MSRALTYATVCSGIECCSVACRGLPMRPVFFSEIEPFPCAVLKARYPDVPNLGDMSKIQVSNDGKEITNGTARIVLDRRIDILAGGTPCQSVSVAGKGEGMREGSGTRSSLAFDFVRLARELGPRYVIWENVANVLSAKHAGDFLHFLANLGDCGYSLAWRVLDAQYVRVDGMERAVPQRRRRVWVVGCAGADESIPAQVLFEPDCVAGHTPPRRRTGEGFAYTLARRDRVDAGVVGKPAARGFRSGSFEQFVNDETCGTLDCEHMNGAANGTPAFAVHDAIALDGGCLNPLDPQSKRVYEVDGTAPCLPSGGGQEIKSIQPCIALDGDKLKPREDQRKGGNGFGINEDGAGYTLTGVDRHGVAYCADGGDVASTITRQISEQSGQDNRANAVVQCYENHAQDSRVQGPIDTAPTQGSSNANSAGVSGNNPLVVHTQTPFVKTAHAKGKDGDGEKWEQCEVAGTRNAIEGGDGRNQECIVHTAMAQNTRDEVRVVGDGNIAGALAAQPGMKQQTYVVSTNSNGEDVAPATLTRDLAKQTGAQQQNGGVHPHPPRGRSAR